MIDDPLTCHLASWLGRWPPRGRLDAVGCAARSMPGWDGRPQPLVAVLAPFGGVVSVPPHSLAKAESALRDAGDAWPAAVAALTTPGRPLAELVLRWTGTPAQLPDAGVWIDPTRTAVPAWLRGFEAPVLAVFDDEGHCLGGVGLKRHDAFGRELAVGVERAHRGLGLARRLVAQAARTVLARGGVPTYAHAPDNVASARVADAAGFSDEGLRLVRFADP